MSDVWDFIKRNVQGTENIGKDIYGGLSKVSEDISPSNLAPVTSASGSTPPTAEQQDVTGEKSDVSKLDYGQEEDPSSATVSSLAKAIGAMSPQDAASALKGLPSTLQTAVNNALSAPASTGNSSPLGFDPLSMGLLFTQVLGPWMAQQASTEKSENANYATTMQQALQGASPQTKTAFQTVIPAMQEAMAGGANAMANEATTEPQFESLIQGLNAATTAAKGTQYAVSELPFAEAAEGVPASTYAAMLQSALSGQGTSAALGSLSATQPSANTLASSFGTPSTASSAATSQAALQNYAQQLLAGGMGT